MSESRIKLMNRTPVGGISFSRYESRGREKEIPPTEELKESVGDFEGRNGVKLPANIAAMLTPQ